MSRGSRGRHGRGDRGEEDGSARTSADREEGRGRENCVHVHLKSASVLVRSVVQLLLQLQVVRLDPGLSSCTQKKRNQERNHEQGEMMNPRKNVRRYTLTIAVTGDPRSPARVLEG